MVEDHKELDRTSGSLFLFRLESSLEFVEFTIFGLNPFIALFIDRHFHQFLYLDLEWRRLVDDL